MAEFKNEYEYLIHLLKCAITDTQPQEKPQELSFEKVFKIGKAHEVANIAFVSLLRLENKPDQETYKAWKTFYAFSISRHANQMAVRKTVVDALSDAKIRTVEVQGTVVKTFYPHPEWRMMTDIDFIIDRKNVALAQQTMEKIGYQTKSSFGSDLELCEVNATAPDGTYVEIHSDFFDHFCICNSAMKNAFSFAYEFEPFNYRVDETTFYLYNLLHCIKHYLQHGTGIRRILDVYVLTMKLEDKVDWTRINSMLETSGFKKAADEIFALSDKWFRNIEPKINLEDAEQTVYMSGNHGTTSVMAKNTYNRMEKTKQKHFKFYAVLSRVFISKAEIYNGYPFCRKYKLPIVLCWFYRAFCIMFDKKRRKKVSNIISALNKKNHS